jgi:dipeptidase E
MPRLLLLSNSTNYGETYLEYPQPAIKSFLGENVKEVLFIPYAGVGFSYDEYTSKVAAPFQEMGYGLRGIQTTDDPQKAIENAEVVAVGGGNTFALLNLLYENDLLGAIQGRVAGGMPFMGWSAGSNIAGPSIRTTNDMPIIEPPSFEALNLIPFQINPHYTEATLPNHGGETRKDRINEFIAINPNMRVVGVPEGNLIEVIDDQVRLVGTDIVKVFEQGVDIKTFTSVDDLSFLLV